MSDRKFKYYSNPGRKMVDKKVEPYIPEYQVRGLEPEEFKSSMVTPELASLMPKESTDNPRTRKPSIRQAYASPTPSPIGRGRGPVPNVGNNMEHTWSGVDGEVIDDLAGSLDPNHQMVDNNDYVVEAASDHENDSSIIENAPEDKKSFLTEIDLKEAIDRELAGAMAMLKTNEYLLIVEDSVVCTGTLEYVQEQASSMLFGEHELCAGNPLPLEKIVVLKRVPIKVGLFLD